MDCARDPKLGVEVLNSGCFCLTLDAAAIEHAFATDPDTRAAYPVVLANSPNLFAATPVFVSQQHLSEMAGIVAAADAVISLPSFQELVLVGSDSITHSETKSTGGVFLSYDFHVTAAGPKLIEINTNAGGAMLNAVLARAQRACCPESARIAVAPGTLDVTFSRMFETEWRRARGERALRSIAIVDENPLTQYLYPEFLLFQQLFRRNGIEAFITDPSALKLHNGTLLLGSEPIDLVYNRLTDFMLDEPGHAVLREAHRTGAVVLTPNPLAHALYANKRNLTVLSDPEHLRMLGVPDATAATLVKGIPRTETVDPSQAERMWAARRKLFFKPTSGFGGKAAYRGDKLTKRVWSEILAGDYVAQAMVPPPERLVGTAGAPQALKFDVRSYVYDGAVQLTTARLYQGQTTNFRTAGGGFAPVFTDVEAS